MTKKLGNPTEILPDSPLRGTPEQKTLVDEAAPPMRPSLPEPPRLPSPPSIPQRTTTVQMISMKTPAEIAQEKAQREAKPVHVQLRSLAEAQRRYPTPPGGLGFLAPPRDPATEPRRGMPTWLYVLGMVIGALALAAAIAAAMWFLAYR